MRRVCKAMGEAGLFIFDLDGTLTVPVLDFDAIRAEAHLPPGPILESVATLSGARRDEVMAVLHAHEERAANNSVLHDGAKETIDALRRAGWRLAVLTRNARHWTEVVLSRHCIAMDAIRTRDDGVIKPSPEPIYALCAQTNCDPRASWMVGDHLFDVQSGRDAGCTTALLLAHNHRPDYADQADHVIENLRELVLLATR